MPPLSVLDLCPIVRDSDASEALRNAADLAQHAERCGYLRYWLAEHHNMVGIASAATAVVIAHVAQHTRTIRVGSGGVMLPNHSPLVIAEQFGTLEALFPGRIDLGLGRAPGSDQATARALRRDNIGSADHFPQDVAELQHYFEPVTPGQAVQAVPGGGLRVPLWILGSSLFGAQLAAIMGLPFAFASHFAPDHLLGALEIYRTHFRPSAQLSKPYAMVAVNAVVADTDAEAARLFTTVQQGFLNLRRGRTSQMNPPVDSMEGLWTPMEEAGVHHMLRYSAVGHPARVGQTLKLMQSETQADEFIVSAPIFDHAARVRSFELLAGVRDSIA